jgi:hypothetical protein
LRRAFTFLVHPALERTMDGDENALAARVDTRAKIVAINNWIKASSLIPSNQCGFALIGKEIAACFGMNNSRKVMGWRRRWTQETQAKSEGVLARTYAPLSLLLLFRSLVCIYRYPPSHQGPAGCRDTTSKLITCVFNIFNSYVSMHADLFRV